MICNYCGYLRGHEEDCIKRMQPSHTIKNYHSPDLLQLRLEKQVAEAAAKWFEVEKTYQDFLTSPLVRGCDKNDSENLVEKIIEVLGQKAVLLLKKE